MLRKREAPETIEELETRKSGFLQSYLPELMNLSGRQRYFVDYEFPQKQQKLVDFWGRALDFALRYYFSSPCASWAELVALFNLEGSGPLGLQALAGELVARGDFLLLREGEDWRWVLEALREKESSGLLRRLKRYVLPRRTSPVRIEGDTHLVSLELLRGDLARLEETLPEIFSDTQLLSESELTGLLRAELGVRGFEAKLLLGLCLLKGRLFCFRERGGLFYHAERLDEETKSARLTLRALERRLAQLQPRLARLEEDCARLGGEAFRLKSAGSKQAALAALQKRRVLTRAAEGLRSQVLLLEDLQLKMGSAQEHKALAALLKRAGDALRVAAEDEGLLQGVEELQDFERGQQDLLAQLRPLDADELEQMYGELDRPAQARVAERAAGPQPEQRDEQQRLNAVVRELLQAE